MFSNLKDKLYKLFRPRKARERLEAREAEARRIALEEEIAKRISDRMQGTRLRTNTLIIFDFDDTLFPTTAYILQESSLWEAEVLAAFARVERAAINLLTLANSLGVVKIVTRANMSWLRRKASKYMPELYELITGLDIEVISVRDNQQNTGNSEKMFKTIEFRNLVQAMILNSGTDPRTNELHPICVASIGDGMYEYIATQKLSQLIPAEQIKIIKLKEEPTVDNLTQQLTAIHGILGSVIDSKQHVCLNPETLFEMDTCATCN